MDKRWIYLMFLFGWMATWMSHASAQSITVIPPNPTVALGKTVPFAAQVTGMSSTDVVWSAGGTKGGNSTAGTISATGLYTAPTTMPGQNPVQIVATSTVNSKIYGLTYVLLLTIGPTITAVTPNPLSTGTITVTVQGKGFLPYAMVYETYGSYSNIQLATVSVTSNTIIATGYQGNATSATFTVKNPGSDFSNAITVPVTASGGGSSGGGNGGGSGGNNNTAPPAHINPPMGAVTTHPRLWIRQQDLPRLCSWANSNNQVWNDLYQVANYMKTKMNQGVVPQLDNGEGDNDNIPNPSEEYAEMFALMSLVDPNVSLRPDWAKRAHDLLMNILNQAVLGPAANTPFRTPHFATYDRSRWYGEAFPLVVDWCYNTFTTSEKQTIRKVFIRWCHELQDFNLSYCPSPAGAYNQPNVLLTPHNIRWSGNNYIACHARNLGMMALALDAADDKQDATIPNDRDNYLGDYIGALMGEWLLIRNYAENHDLKGGLGTEGPLYSEMVLRAYSELLLALHTTGYDDPTVYGPQAAMAQNTFWTTDALAGYCQSLSPGLAKLQNWWPAQNLPASYGDSLRFDDEDMICALAPMAILDLADGNTESTRLGATRWAQTWLPPGQWANLDSRLTSSPWNFGTMLPIMYFLMFDPALADPVTKQPIVTDPRPSMGLDFLAPGLNRILSRTDWTPSASWFAFISTWSVSDHQWDDSNSFSFYRKGEFLTKEWCGYGMNVRCTDYQNNLSIENPPLSPNALSYNLTEASHGSQYSYTSDGDPVVKTSLTPTYVYAEGDSTKRYNSTPYQATDAQHVSRSIFWIKPSSPGATEFVVVYDRAISKSPNKFKRVNFNFTTQPNVNGHNATVVTPNGQNVYFTNVLPATATVTWDHPSPSWLSTEAAEYEINQYRICVEDLSKPQSVRYLNVLQGADAGASKALVSNISSSAGSPYDGAWFNNTAVLFAQNLGQAFTGVTYTVPASTTVNYITGLTPGAGYMITETPGANGITVSVQPGGTTYADSAGVLRF